MKHRIAISLLISATILLAGCVGESGDPTPALTPQATISRTDMGIEPIDPGESLPASSDMPFPEETGEATHDLSISNVSRLFGPISHYLNDGASLEVYEFDAAVQQDNEFYQGVIYFYLCAVDGQPDAGISMEVSDSIYRITKDDLQKVFSSYFGSRFDIEAIFSANLGEDGTYQFQMSDGPIYSAALIVGGNAPEGATDDVEVQTMMEDGEGAHDAGTFKATLEVDSNSIFGYTISSYTFTPAGQ